MKTHYVRTLHTHTIFLLRCICKVVHYKEFRKHHSCFTPIRSVFVHCEELKDQWKIWWYDDECSKTRTNSKKLCITTKFKTSLVFIIQKTHQI